jgi:hypothetical protein
MCMPLKTERKWKKCVNLKGLNAQLGLALINQMSLI